MDRSVRVRWSRWRAGFLRVARPCGPLSWRTVRRCLSPRPAAVAPRQGGASPATSTPLRSGSSGCRAGTISRSCVPAATWPITHRAPAAKEVTTCSGERVAAWWKERRSVLPSVATPRRAAPSVAREAEKQPAKAAGSSGRNGREWATWPGRPPCRSSPPAPSPAYPTGYAATRCLAEGPANQRAAGTATSHSVLRPPRRTLRDVGAPRPLDPRPFMPLVTSPIQRI